MAEKTLELSRRAWEGIIALMEEIPPGCHFSFKWKDCLVDDDGIHHPDMTLVITKPLESVRFDMERVPRVD